MEKIRVLLADDHPVVRRGIRSLLQSARDVVIVAEADNGADILALIEQHEPDVLILDIEMPELSGVEVARQIKEKNLPVRILALSAYSDERYVHNVLANGASGYLVKEEAPEMILEAVRGVALGKDGWISRQAAAQMNVFRRQDGAGSELTPREHEVLRLIADGKSNQEIALMLGISVSTVEKHVSAILMKMDVASRVEAAVRAVRDGQL